MAGLSRKDLKHDRFVEEVGESVRFFRSHRNQVIGGAVLVIAAIVGVSSWVGYQRSQAEAAQLALQEAVRLYHGTVTTEPRAGVITFATTGERMRRTTDAFEQLKLDFPSSESAVASEYYLALLEVEDGKTSEARERLQRLVSGSSKGNYVNPARLTLAQMLAREGKIDEARGEFESLIKNPSAIVPAERAKLELARMLVEHDPAAAKPLLEELSTVQGPVSAAASLALSRLPQGT